MRSTTKVLIFATVACLGASVAQAQLTWDVVPGTVGIGDNAITHSNGVWDLTTANWTPNGGTNNQTWVSASEAVFSKAPDNAQIVIDVGTGIEVGDLTVAHSNGNGNVILRGLADNTQMTLAPGGATWTLGGRYLELLANLDNDLYLSMTSNDTLTVVSGDGIGGTFDTGEKPSSATWLVDNCTLDFQATNGTLKGNAGSVGRFETVKMVDGTTYMHERNGNQTYGINDWVLDGVVTFRTRWARKATLNGAISGAGGVRVYSTTFNDSQNDVTYQFGGSTNTYTGGTTIDASSKVTVLAINGDIQLGAVPGAADANNITLKNNGYLRMNAGVSLNANRGITLDNGGGFIANGGVAEVNGVISGSGSLLIGRTGDNSGNVVQLNNSGNDYAGQTIVKRGTLQLGIDNALPTNSVLNLGGASTTQLQMDGKNQTVGGLTQNASNTRQIRNDSATPSTLTINVADGSLYSYTANFVGTGDIDLVKEGSGIQRLQRNGNYTKFPTSLTINDGVLEQSGTAFAVPITVNAGGTLGGIGTTLADVVVNSGGSIAPGNNGGWNSVKITGGDLDLSGMVDDNAGGLEIGFGAAKDSIVVSTNTSGVGGTVNLGGSLSFKLGFSDFTFTHDTNHVLNSGTYSIIVATALDGNLDPSDLSGPVGDQGFTGQLSKSNDTVYLTVNASPYASWANDYGLPADSENVDTDGDGYDNLQEFAYGGDPTNAALVGYAPAAGTLDQGGTNWLTLAYGYRSATDPGVTYESRQAISDSLVFGGWTNAGITELGTGTLDADFDTVTNAIPMDSTQDFLGVFLEKQ